MAFALLVACDAPDEEQVRLIVGTAVQDNLTDVRADQKAANEANAKLVKEVAALDASVKGQTAAIDGALAHINKLEARLTRLETNVAASAKAAAKAEADAAVEAAKPVAKVYKVILGDGHTRGSDDAPVTILQYSDYECPHCSRMGPVLDVLKTKYGTDVRFAFKHYPLKFHTHARAAAIAAEAAAEQDKFWEMHNKIFENSSTIDDANLLAWAKGLGLDMKRFKADIADATIAKRVDDMKAEGEALGIAGTPHFYVNGRHVVGGNTREVFEALVDEELPKARALIASGVEAKRVYERTIETGLPRVDSEY